MSFRTVLGLSGLLCFVTFVPMKSCRCWTNEYRLCPCSGDIFRVKPCKVVVHIIVSARKVTMGIVLGVHHHPDAHLFEIAEALRALCLFLGPGKRRQEY